MSVLPRRRPRPDMPPAVPANPLMHYRPLGADGRQDLKLKAPYGPDPYVFGDWGPSGAAPVYPFGPSGRCEVHECEWRGDSGGCVMCETKLTDC